MSVRRYVFNLCSKPSSEVSDVTYLYSDDPVIELEEAEDTAAVLQSCETDKPSVFCRNRAQFKALKQLPEEGRKDHLPMDSPFSIPLECRYREYRVRRHWAPDGPGEPLGNSPSAFRTLVDTPQSPHDEYLYLFNVLVALEWIPSQEYLQRLKWGFRRASDLLNDVTNGTMAFGQVIFADSRWMGCADIQIMASNRLLPRSWVAGLLEEDKYTPIRVGRGVWTREGQVAIPWDEPDAYRNLVHEWAHYALNQRDEYLSTIPGVEAFKELAERSLNPDDYTVVVPQQRSRSNSIMATPRGNSELDYPIHIEKQDDCYPNLPTDRLNRVFAGPGRLPLPLPTFHCLGTLAGESQDNEMTLTVPADIEKPDRCWVYVLHPKGDDKVERVISQGTLDARSRDHGFQLLGVSQGNTILLMDESDVNQPKLWSTTVRTPNDAAREEFAQVRQWEEVSKALDGSDQLEKSNPGQPPLKLRVPARILAAAKANPGTGWSLRVVRNQNGMSTCVHKEDFTPSIDLQTLQILDLGAARAGDTVELQRRDSKDEPSIWRGMIHHIAEDRVARLEPWWGNSLGLGKDESPLIYVQPDRIPDRAPQAEGDAAAQVRAKEGEDTPPQDKRRVKIRIGGRKEAGQDSVFPLGGSGVPREKDGSYDVPTLDGHVKVDLDPGKYVISTYSQGGNPASAPPVITNPITAGTADGQVFLFFDTKTAGKDKEDYSKYRVVTTTLHGSWDVPLDVKAVSNVFSISSNEPLPPEYHPTLTMLFDSATVGDAQVWIYRRVGDRHPPGWIRLPTYVHPGTSLAATPLAAPPIEPTGAGDKERGGGSIIQRGDDGSGNKEVAEGPVSPQATDHSGDEKYVEYFWLCVVSKQGGQPEPNANPRTETERST